jgi:hypothetical protein
MMGLERQLASALPGRDRGWHARLVASAVFGPDIREASFGDTWLTMTAREITRDHLPLIAWASASEAVACIYDLL